MMELGGISSGGSFLDQIQKQQEKNAEKLASGKKINSAADGAAAQQIIERLTAESNAYQQSLSNSYDGVSLTQVADGALSGINADASRIQELTLQAGNGIYSDADRQAIQSEITQLQEGIQDTIQNTEFNGKSLFTGDNEFNFQVGSGAGQKISVGSPDVESLYNSLGVGNIDVTQAGGVEAGLETLENFSSEVNSARGDLGATQNSFESTINNLATTNENVQAAKSRLQDTDYAQATSEQAANDVRGQAATSVAAQARQQQSSVLNLLQ